MLWKGGEKRIKTAGCFDIVVFLAILQSWKSFAQTSSPHHGHESKAFVPGGHKKIKEEFRNVGPASAKSFPYLRRGHRGRKKNNCCCWSLNCTKKRKCFFFFALVTMSGVNWKSKEAPLGEMKRQPRVKAPGHADARLFGQALHYVTPTCRGSVVLGRLTAGPLVPRRPMAVVRLRAPRRRVLLTRSGGTAATAPLVTHHALR